MKQITPIEEVVDIHDETIQWYDIPLFDGYQISNSNFMVRRIDGSQYGSFIESKVDKKDVYRGNKHVYIDLVDGRKVNAKNAELWDLVVRGHIQPKSTAEAVYSGYDSTLFPDCNAVTGLPNHFKLIGKIRRKGGTDNGVI